MRGKCAKCGSAQINRLYHGGARMCGYGFSHNKSFGEHMHYFCRGCGYDWTGPTLDSAAIERAIGRK